MKKVALLLLATLPIFACTLRQAPPERPQPEPDTVMDEFAQPDTNPLPRLWGWG